VSSSGTNAEQRRSRGGAAAVEEEEWLGFEDGGLEVEDRRREC